MQTSREASNTKTNDRSENEQTSKGANKMTIAKKPKIKICFPPIEIGTFEIKKISRSSTDSEKVLYLAKRLGIGEDDGWMRIWHNDRELRVNDVVECTVVIDVDAKGRDCYRIKNIHRLYPA